MGGAQNGVNASILQQQVMAEWPRYVAALSAPGI